MRGAQAGSVSDLEALFDAHWPRAYRAAYLVLGDGAAAEDVAQEAFLAAVRALDRFDRRRPFGPWLHRIVVNRAIDHARARAKSIARLTTIRCSHGPNGRRRSNRSRARTAARNASCAMSSAAPPSPTTK